MDDYAHSVNDPTINVENLQNVAYFKIWKHRYIDMFPHVICLGWKVAYLQNVETLLY